MPARTSITVREFEYLTPKGVGRADCHVLTPKQFASLREFVLANRDGDSPLELMHLCSPKGIGEAIQLRNYVGVVELRDGLQIEILPKIDTTGKSEAFERDIFRRMLAELGTDVSFKSLDMANLSTGKMPLFEVFIAMFLEEVAQLVRTGLQSAYVSTEAEERFIRGKIDFSKEARKNPAHAEVLNLVYDELRVDRPENRLVKTTLIKLRKVSRDGGNVRRATQLLGSFEGVGLSHNVDADLARCVRDRFTRAYETLIAWCRVFLKGESFTMFRGRDVATALLFPMEKIFEDYVGRKLRREAIRCGAVKRVDLQARGQWLFNDRQISLRPDILCTRLNGRLVVLDTKWKRVIGRKDLSPADMHQMYAYGQRYRAEAEELQRVILLYPWHEGVESGLKRDARLVSNDGVQVDLFFVDLANMSDSLEELIEVVGGD